MRPNLKFYCDHKRHLVCIPYSIENLHRMASELGIKRCWFHKDHYDIPKLRNSTILAAGLVAVVDSRLIVRIVRDKIQNDGELNLSQQRSEI